MSIKCDSFLKTLKHKTVCEWVLLLCLGPREGKLQGPTGVEKPSNGWNLEALLCAEPFLSREFHWKEGFLGPGVQLGPLGPY